MTLALVKSDPGATTRHDAVGLVQLPRERRLDVLPSLLGLPAAGSIDFTASKQGMAGRVTAAQLTAALAGLDRLPTALRLPELLANTFVHLSARDGWQAAAVCKAWRGPWRQRLKGMLRCVRRAAPLPKYNHRVSAGAGGVLVADYNHGYVNLYSQTGDLVRVYDQPNFEVMNNGSIPDDELDFYGLGYPHCVVEIPNSDGLAWAIENDDCNVILIRLTDGRRLRDIDFEQPDEIRPHSQILPLSGQQPRDLAIAGDALLVLCADDQWVYGRVVVLDVNTGAFRYCFAGEVGTAEELRDPESFAVAGDLVYIPEKYNHQVKVFRIGEGTWTLVRTFGRAGTPPEVDEDDPYWNNVYPYDDPRIGAGPGEFNEPWGIAVGKRCLYVSESSGARIQVLSLPDGEPMHIVRSPDGLDLTGMCFTAFPDGTGARVWCCGSGWGYPQESPLGHRTQWCVHIFAICD